MLVFTQCFVFSWIVPVADSQITGLSDYCIQIGTSSMKSISNRW